MTLASESPISWRQRLLDRVPTSLRRRLVIPLINELGGFLVDSGTWLLGESDPLLPPRRLQVGGTGNFKGGYEFLGYFRDLAGLKSDEDVLDIGCGVGRMAVVLTGYMKTGSYTGIDIVSAGITWCQTHITPRYPHFEFHHADIFNEAYNARGKHRACDYRFPFADASF